MMQLPQLTDSQKAIIYDGFFNLAPNTENVEFI